MKEVLIIGRRQPGEKNDVTKLAAELKRRRLFDVDFGYFEDVIVTIRGGEVTVELDVGSTRKKTNQFELIIQIGWSHDKLYSDLAHVIALIAHREKVEIWNSELIAERSMSKLSQLVKTASLNIPVPDTIFCLDLEKTIANNFLDLPLISKDPKASRGRRNFLINSTEELAKHIGRGYSLLLQEYIPNDSSDIRVIIAGGAPALAFRRIGQGGSHLHNTSTGAHAERIDLNDLPTELTTESQRLAKLFKRELCGIDFIFDTVNHRHTFLEINATPQLVSGVFVEEKMDALAKAIMN